VVPVCVGMAHSHLVDRKSVATEQGHTPTSVHRPVSALGHCWIEHQGRCPWIAPLELPLDYISRVSFQGHTAVRDRTHGTIYMTGCQCGAGGFRPWGPPMQGGALLRSTGPQRSAPPPHTGRPPVAGTRPAAPDLPLPNPGKRCAAMLSSYLRYHDATRTFAPGAAPSGDGLGHCVPLGRGRSGDGAGRCQAFCWWISMCERKNIVLVVGAPLPDRVPVCFRVGAVLLRPERSAGILRTAARAHRRPTLRTSAPSA